MLRVKTTSFGLHSAELRSLFVSLRLVELELRLMVDTSRLGQRSRSGEQSWLLHIFTFMLLEAALLLRTCETSCPRWRIVSGVIRRGAQS